MTVLAGGRSGAAHLSGACSFTFELRQRRGESASIVIDCELPTGQRSRMTIEESDWQKFIEGFIQAATHSEIGQGPIVHADPPAVAYIG